MNLPTRTIMDADEIARSIRRMAHEIIEANHGAAEVMVLGIPSGGSPLGRRIAALLGEIEGIEVAVGDLDITMYRDDLRSNPTRYPHPTHIPGEITGKHIVLVDDVLFSGRTIAAALDALKDFGRPASVQLAVLVDRGHRELPIAAKYVGKTVPTNASERVRVHLHEIDGADEVIIEGCLA